MDAGHIETFGDGFGLNRIGPIDGGQDAVELFILGSVLDVWFTFCRGVTCNASTDRNNIFETLPLCRNS